MSFFFYLYILAAVLQCAYALLLFRRILLLPAAAELPVQDRQPVSIIICARNEATNLRLNLPAILAQRYSNDAGKALFEVIVVDDGSTDDTAGVLNHLRDTGSQFRVVVGPAAGQTGKKAALRAGCGAALHDWLVLIDADCRPASTRWLGLMVAPLAAGKEIVAGYGGYVAARGWLNAFIRLETIHTFFQYCSSALSGMPYMAVGRNMACTKAVMQKVQQTELWNKLPSGDDDLLVQVAGTARNTAVVCNRDAFTWSPAKNTFTAWVQQKQRHLSTGKYYKLQTKLLLAGYGISHAVLWLGFLTLFFSRFWYIVFPVMASRKIYWFLWGKLAVNLREQKIVYLLPLFDLAWMLYNFAFLPYITWKNKTRWK